MKIRKYLIYLLFLMITACNFIYGDNNMNTLNTKVNIKINNKEYKLILYNNQTAKDFLSILPLNINMKDLNNNEKYYNLNQSLTVKSENIGSIKRGDFLLYGNNCIVLFYESFKTSYRYTRIGYIENVSGLKEILGKGNADIVFSIN